MTIKILALTFLMVSSAHAQWATQRWEYSPLEKALLKIRHEPGRDNILSLERKEKEALALLKDHGSPSEQAAIYSSIALSYSDGGWYGQEIGLKSAKYCEEALKYPLDAPTAADLYSYWAEAISLLENHDGHLKGEALASHRKKVTVIVLKGLKVTLDNLTQDKAAPPPGVGSFVCVGNCDGSKEKHAQQMVERNRVDFQNTLVRNRDSLIYRIVMEYFPYDSDTGGLKQLASEILTPAHSNVVQKIIDDLSTARADKEKRHEVFTSTSTPKVVVFKRAKKVTKVSGTPTQ